MATPVIEVAVAPIEVVNAETDPPTFPRAASSPVRHAKECVQLSASSVVLYAGVLFFVQRAILEDQPGLVGVLFVIPTLVIFQSRTLQGRNADRWPSSSPQERAAEGHTINQMSSICGNLLASGYTSYAPIGHLKWADAGDDLVSGGSSSYLEDALE